MARIAAIPRNSAAMDRTTETRTYPPTAAICTMTRYRTTASKAPPAAMARIVFMRTGTLAAVGGRNNDLPKGRKRVLRRVHASTGSLRSYDSTRRACLRADPYSGGPAEIGREHV